MIRKRGGRGFVNIEKSVDTSIQKLENNIKKRLIRKGRNSIGNINTGRKRIKTRKQICVEKQVNGYFKRQTGEFVHEKTGT